MGVCFSQGRAGRRRDSRAGWAAAATASCVLRRKGSAAGQGAPLSLRELRGHNFLLLCKRAFGSLYAGRQSLNLLGHVAPSPRTERADVPWPAGEAGRPPLQSRLSPGGGRAREQRQPLCGGREGTGPSHHSGGQGSLSPAQGGGASPPSCPARSLGLAVSRQGSFSPSAWSGRGQRQQAERRTTQGKGQSQARGSWERPRGPLPLERR